MENDNIVRPEQWKKKFNGHGDDNTPPGGGPPMDEIALEKRFGSIEGKLDGIDIKLIAFEKHYTTKADLTNVKVWFLATAAIQFFGIIGALNIILRQ